LIHQKQEEDRMKREEDRMKQEEDRMKREEDRMKQEEDRMKQEEDRMKQEEDRMTQEEDRMKQEEDRMKQEEMLKSVMQILQQKQSSGMKQEEAPQNSLLFPMLTCLLGAVTACLVMWTVGKGRKGKQDVEASIL
jgi:flagellar biosynthesis GTPase FlhF